MFTIENLHSELEHGGVRVQVIVECYCFLINIIDENIETLPLLPRSISIQKTNGFARWRREVA